MAEAGDGSGHTPLTPEWTTAPRATYYPWQGDRPAAAPSLLSNLNIFNNFSPQFFFLYLKTLHLNDNYK